MASILSFANRVFRTRSPDRDASTDRDRLLTVRAAIVAAIEGATSEQMGLRTRVEGYYAQASHILDQASFEERSSADEREIVEAERHGRAGLARIAAIEAQLRRLNEILEFFDAQDAATERVSPRAAASRA
jgi:hypothetical protein